MKKAILKAINIIHVLLMDIAQLFIIGMVLIVTANVVLRYVFNSGLYWSEEVALLLCVWFIFISLALGIKQRLNIVINIIPTKKMPAWFNTFLEYLTHFVVIFVGVVMVVYGRTLVQFTMRSIMPATKWPSGILYAVVPFAGATIVLESLLHIVKWDTYDKNLDEYFLGERKFKNIFGGPHG